MTQSQYERKKTRQIKVGKVLVGGDAPISVQSMTITKTADVEGILIEGVHGPGVQVALLV